METNSPPVAPKPRRRWGSTILSILLTIVCLFIIGLFTASKTLDEHLDEKPEGTADSFCATLDEEAPMITLNGAPFVTVKVGSDFDDEGATADDSCEAVEVLASGTVDTTKVGTYKITYTSTDSLANKSTAERTVKVVPKFHGTIYLTFDDGPGIYTNQLLDVLKKYNVKATFFVTGGGDDAIIKREYDEGHAIGLHTLSHNYAYIYQNTDNFFADLYAVQERVKKITGYTSMLMRFPGGSSNTVSYRYDGRSRIMTRLANEVTVRGFTYFDWNISSGDAGEVYTADAVYNRVVYALKEYGDSVVLQHDVKSFSVDAVERIIKFGLDNGYEFKKLDASSPTAHHRINN